MFSVCQYCFLFGSGFQYADAQLQEILFSIEKEPEIMLKTAFEFQLFVKAAPLLGFNKENNPTRLLNDYCIHY